MGAGLEDLSCRVSSDEVSDHHVRGRLSPLPLTANLPRSSARACRHVYCEPQGRGHLTKPQQTFVMHGNCSWLLILMTIVLTLKLIKNVCIYLTFQYS